MAVRVLCVCTGNTSRSPMLQVLLARALKEGNVEAIVESAGVGSLPGSPASHEAITVMQRRSLDLSNHQTNGVPFLDLSMYDFIFALSPSHASRLGGGFHPEVVHVVAEKSGGIGDPSGGSIEEYEVCAAMIEKELPNLLKIIIDGIAKRNPTDGK